MKRAIFLSVVLLLAALACNLATPTPAPTIHDVETIAAATLTALAPTQAPPTLIPLPTFVPPPSATPFPTLPPVGNTPIRIQFNAGAVSAAVVGTVAFPNRPQYVLYAFKGQRFTAQVTSTGDVVNFALTGVTDGQSLKRLENEDRSWTGLLPVTQDYLLTLAVPGGSADFTLTVTIVWP